MIKKMKNKIKSAQSSLEFLVVFVVLFTFFVGILDLGLFFRQMYLVQTLSDEVLARLETNHSCSHDLALTTDIMKESIKYYHGANPELTFVYDSGFYNFKSDRYYFSLSCRNPKTPDALSFGYLYKGIIFYRSGRMIFSNYSSNTSFL